MWLLTRLAIVSYITILWITSLIILLFACHLLDLDILYQILYEIYYDPKMRFMVGALAVGVIALTIVMENLIYGRRRMERTIAFDNPSGPVVVSLSALEDVIKHLTHDLPQIREIRPFMMANNKGIDVETKLILRSQANIPDLTSRLQDLIKRKIEEVIGMEGKVNVRVHVIKIVLDEIKSTKRNNVEIEGTVPFHGYRA